MLRLFKFYICFLRISSFIFILVLRLRLILLHFSPSFDFELYYLFLFLILHISHCHGFNFSWFIIIQLLYFFFEIIVIFFIEIQFVKLGGLEVSIDILIKMIGPKEGPDECNTEMSDTSSCQNSSTNNLSTNWFTDIHIVFIVKASNSDNHQPKLMKDNHYISEDLLVGSYHNIEYHHDDW